MTSESPGTTLALSRLEFVREFTAIGFEHIEVVLKTSAFDDFGYPTRIAVTGRLGSRIDRTAGNCIQLANKYDTTVALDWNGLILEITGKDREGEVVTRWNIACDLQNKAYQQSAEGKAAAEKQRLELLDRQATIDELMAYLPSIVSLRSHMATIEWLSRFVLPADYVGVVYDKQAVILALECQGYLANENVGHPKVTSDPDVAARWLVGQALDCLRGPVGTIHPMMSEFASKYIKKYGS